MTAPRLAPLTVDQRVMVERNLGLVAHTLKLYYPRLVGSDDAWQDGVIGLARATRDYQADRAKFSTYAMPWIRSEIGNGIGRLNGINARHAHRVGESYEPPASLDAALDDWAPLGDLLADPGIDPVGAACDRVQLAAVADTLRTAARDDLDADIAPPHHRPDPRPPRRHPGRDRYPAWCLGLRRPVPGPPSRGPAALPPRPRERVVTATVIGCVYGAHRALVERMERIGEPEPTYEWCEQQWRTGLAKRAPGDRAIPEWLLQELFFRWRHHVRSTGQQLALDLGSPA